MRLKLSLGLFACLIGSSGYAQSLMDQILLHPTQDRVYARGAQRKVLSSGLEVWIRKKPSFLESAAQKIKIIHFIGNSSRAEQETLDLRIVHSFPWDQSVEVWSVNYPGFGGSSGEATLNSIPKAALEAYDALYDPRAKMIISGSSIGTTAALYVARNRSANGLILKNPPALHKMVASDYGWRVILAELSKHKKTLVQHSGAKLPFLAAAHLLKYEIPADLNSIRNASRGTQKAIFLRSENDEIVPEKFQKKVIKHYTGPKREILLPGVGHNDDVPFEAVPEIEEALKWVLE